MVQEYAKLYDFSALTGGAASTEAFARTNAPAPAGKAISLFGLFDGLFDDGFGPPENWGPKPLTVMDVGDGSLSMKDFAKAVVPGTANAILETGEMVNKGIGIVDQAAEAVELLGLDPEELKAPEGTDQLLLGKKGAAALKVVDYAKKGYDAYPIGGTHANHAITLLDIATCKFRLGKTDGIDELIEKAKHIYFDTYDHIELYDYNKTMGEMLKYFTKEYNKKKLNEYKPLDLSEIEKRIAEKNADK